MQTHYLGIDLANDSFQILIQNPNKSVKRNLAIYTYELTTTVRLFLPLNQEKIGRSVKAKWRNRKSQL
jgi:hypothetical protein